jgi:hypothetical protein
MTAKLGPLVWPGTMTCILSLLDAVTVNLVDKNNNNKIPITTNTNKNRE